MKDLFALLYGSIALRLASWTQNGVSVFAAGRRVFLVTGLSDQDIHELAQHAAQLANAKGNQQRKQLTEECP